MFLISSGFEFGKTLNDWAMNLCNHNSYRCPKCTVISSICTFNVNQISTNYFFFSRRTYCTECNFWIDEYFSKENALNRPEIGKIKLNYSNCVHFICLMFLWLQFHLNDTTRHRSKE